MTYRTVIPALAILSMCGLLRPDGALCFQRSPLPSSACVPIPKSMGVPQPTVSSGLPTPSGRTCVSPDRSSTNVGAGPRTPWNCPGLSGGDRPSWLLNTKSFFEEPRGREPRRGSRTQGDGATLPRLGRPSSGSPPAPVAWWPGVSSFQIGGIYASTPDSRRSHMALDLFVPMRGNSEATSFLQVHSQLPHPEFRGSGDPSPRSDVSAGVGLRIGSSHPSVVGMNLFVDAARIGGQLHGSGGLGFEYARQVNSLPKQVMDFAFNLYLGGGVEAETGYSSALTSWLDGRVFLAKTRFFNGEYLLGWRGGVDLTGSHRTLGLRYEYGQDRINTSSHTVMAYASLPLQLENLFKGKSPISLPSPPVSR